MKDGRDRETEEGGSIRPWRRSERKVVTRVGFTVAPFATTKRWKQPKCAPVGEQINTRRGLQTMGHYSGRKRNEATCYDMDEP